MNFKQEKIPTLPFNVLEIKKCLFHSWMIIIAISFVMLLMFTNMV